MATFDNGIYLHSILVFHFFIFLYLFVIFYSFIYLMYCSSCVNLFVGGEWKLLNPPRVNYWGKPTNCTVSKVHSLHFPILFFFSFLTFSIFLLFNFVWQGCSLHLHGLTSWVAGVSPAYYTSPNAIGLVIGVGMY